MRARVVDTLFDAGSCKKCEDGLFIRLIKSNAGPRLIAGVFDGIDIPQPPEKVKTDFNGMTGGRFVYQAICSALSLIESEPLDTALQDANTFIREVLRTVYKMDVYTTPTALLPGATFAVVDITDKRARLIQGGDCLAIWQKLYKDVTRMDGTPNKVFQANPIILDYIARHRCAWDEAVTALQEQLFEIQNRANTANGWAVINGQPNVNCFWTAIDLPRTVERLILFSDGFYYSDPETDTQEMALNILRDFRAGGLKTVLKMTRHYENVFGVQYPPYHKEATALAIEFD